MAEFSGLTAVVTGGGSGIGLATARLLAQCGADAAVTADEVAAAIAYLASPLAASVTGTALAVDGGMAGLLIGPRS